MQKKSKRRATRGSGHDPGGRIFGKRADPQANPSDRHDPTGEAVHVVNQVHGIHKADDPQHGHEIRDRLHADDLDAYAAKEQQRRDPCLTRKLGRGCDVAEVVEEA